jgi:hypothetical protein
MKKTVVLKLWFAFAAMLVGSSAMAQPVASDEQLFGAASYVIPGNASPRAVMIEADVPGEFGGVNYPTPVPVKIEDLDFLSTDYMFPTGSTCGGGAPRFVLRIMGLPAGSNQISVYIGPPPSYTGCPAGVWSNTGNLLTPVSLVDASQTGGPFYEPWAATQTRLAGSIVSRIFLVTDTFAGPRTTIADNTNVNNILYTYDSPQTADQCKKGGWESLSRADGSPFKNQGDCIQYVNTGK